MHEEIVRYTREVVVEDGPNSIRSINSQKKDVLDELYEDGYIPVVDISPQCSTSYDHNKNSYMVKISIYAVFVGGDVPLRGKVMMDGKILKDV